MLSHMLLGEEANPMTPLWRTFEDSTWLSRVFAILCAFSLQRFYFPSFAIISYTWKHKNFLRLMVLENPNVTLRHIFNKSAYSFSSKRHVQGYCISTLKHPYNYKQLNVQTVVQLLYHIKTKWITRNATTQNSRMLKDRNQTQRILSVPSS